MNKRGLSAGFLFIVVLVALFASGLMYILLNQVYTNFLFNQTVIDSVLSTLPNSNATEVAAVQTSMNLIWISLPVFIVIMIILYIIVKAQASGGKNQ